MALGQEQRRRLAVADARSPRGSRSTAGSLPTGSISTAGWPPWRSPPRRRLRHRRRRPAPRPPPAPPAGTSLPPRPSPPRLSLEIGELIYNKQPVRNIALELEARGGAVAVPKLTATLPGDHGAAGQVDHVGRSRRGRPSPAISAWSAEAARDAGLARGRRLVGAAPTSSRELSLKGRMASSGGGNVQVSDAVFELDDLKGSGGVVVTFSVPLSVVTQVSIDTLDLDSYLAARRPTRSRRRRPHPRQPRRPIQRRLAPRSA